MVRKIKTDNSTARFIGAPSVKTLTRGFYAFALIFVFLMMFYVEAFAWRTGSSSYTYRYEPGYGRPNLGPSTAYFQRPYRGIGSSPNPQYYPDADPWAQQPWFNYQPAYTNYQPIMPWQNYQPTPWYHPGMFIPQVPRMPMWPQSGLPNFRFSGTGGGGGGKGGRLPPAPGSTGDSRYETHTSNGTGTAGGPPAGRIVPPSAATTTAATPPRVDLNCDTATESDISRECCLMRNKAGCNPLENSGCLVESDLVYCIDDPRNGGVYMLRDQEYRSGGGATSKNKYISAREERAPADGDPRLILCTRDGRLNPQVKLRYDNEALEKYLTKCLEWAQPNSGRIVPRPNSGFASEAQFLGYASQGGNGTSQAPAAAATTGATPVGTAQGAGPAAAESPASTTGTESVDRRSSLVATTTGVTPSGTAQGGNPAGTDSPAGGTPGSTEGKAACSGNCSFAGRQLQGDTTAKQIVAKAEAQALAAGSAMEKGARAMVAYAQQSCESLPGDVFLESLAPEAPTAPASASAAATPRGRSGRARAATGSSANTSAAPADKAQNAEQAAYNQCPAHKAQPPKFSQADDTRFSSVAPLYECESNSERSCMRLSGWNFLTQQWNSDTEALPLNGFRFLAGVMAISGAKLANNQSVSESFKKQDTLAKLADYVNAPPQESCFVVPEFEGNNSLQQGDTLFMRFSSDRARNNTRPEVRGLVIDRFVPTDEAGNPFGFPEGVNANKCPDERSSNPCNESINIDKFKFTISYVTGDTAPKMKSSSVADYIKTLNLEAAKQEAKKLFCGLAAQACRAKTNSAPLNKYEARFPVRSGAVARDYIRLARHQSKKTGCIAPPEQRAALPKSICLRPCFEESGLKDINVTH